MIRHHAVPAATRSEIDSVDYTRPCAGWGGNVDVDAKRSTVAFRIHAAIGSLRDCQQLDAFCAIIDRELSFGFVNE